MADQFVDYPVRQSGIHIESNATMGHFPLLSWRAIWAGFFIALLVSTILICLGLAIGGASLARAASGGGGGGLGGIGAGLWFLISALIALFVGGYYAARVSNFITSRVGASQGIVISALFFAIIIAELSFGIGLAVRGGAAAANFLGVGPQDLSRNPEVQAALVQTLGTNKLKSDPETVVEGLAARLAAGDQAGARDFLASQTGISKTEADRRIAEIAPVFQQAMRNAAVVAARSVSAVGWTLFLTLLLGACFAALGGGLGARSNYRKPLAREIPQGAPTMTPVLQT